MSEQDKIKVVKKEEEKSQEKLQKVWLKQQKGRFFKSFDVLGYRVYLDKDGYAEVPGNIAKEICSEIPGFSIIEDSS